MEKLDQLKTEINEISWNRPGDMFYLTTGDGDIQVMSYPELQLLHTIHAHPANCYCIEFDPLGR